MKDFSNLELAVVEHIIKNGSGEALEEACDRLGLPCQGMDNTLRKRLKNWVWTRKEK
jgi:hypothetical protein